MKTILKIGNCEAVCDSFGGELISYRHNGREIVWTGDGTYWTGHTPVLFPIVGALVNDTVEIDGAQYSMKKHGFARKSFFELVAATDTTATYELKNSEATAEMYPYAFSLKIKHEIFEDGFKTTYTVKNPSDKEIVFAIGGHPGFCLGNIEDYKLVFPEEEDCPLYYTDPASILSDKLVQGGIKGKEMALKYSDYDVDALIAKDLKSRKTSIVKLDGSFKLDFEWTGFDVLGIWTPPKKCAPFLCLEPWNGCPAYDTETGKFADKPYVKTLAAGEEYSVGYSVKL